MTSIELGTYLGPYPKQAGRKSNPASAEAVYRFIVEFKREHDGNSPTYREIMESCGVSSTVSRRCLTPCRSRASSIAAHECWPCAGPGASARCMGILPDQLARNEAAMCSHMRAASRAARGAAAGSDCVGKAAPDHQPPTGHVDGQRATWQACVAFLHPLLAPSLQQGGAAQRLPATESATVPLRLG